MRRAATPVADLFAYCLLRNHFHIATRVKSEEEILETRKTLKVSRPAPKHDIQEKPLGLDSMGSRYVSDKFSNFFNAYAKTINKAYGRTGSLFRHPFGRVPITTDYRPAIPECDCLYSPKSDEAWIWKDFRDWKYSSYGMILNQKHTPIKRKDVMKWFGTRDTYLSLHQQWVTDAQAKRLTDSDFD